MTTDYRSLLIKEYNRMVNWQPDREEVGIQFGPQPEEIRSVVAAIKKIDPEWLTDEEEEALRLQTRIDEFLDTKVSQFFPGLKPNKFKIMASIPNPREYIKKCRDFISQCENESLRNLSDSQLSWLLKIAWYGGFESTVRDMSDTLKRIGRELR